MPNDETCLPDGAMERLSLFAKWTDTTPPENVMEGTGDERTFSNEFLRFCQETGLSLDWFWMGDARSLVMQAFNAAQGNAA
ncbi:hypothetical protein [Roseovarius sp. PS-C2]|uniref:hypothetical protein n=1 Tax=Roseovarius sp. PS-C2 TaxID=2820814 RepID=UPI00209ADEF2|nr:hypothetical protein [Roseovarius sp. PS-C2]